MNESSNTPTVKAITAKVDFTLVNCPAVVTLVSGDSAAFEREVIRKVASKFDDIAQICALIESGDYSGKLTINPQNEWEFTYVRVTPTPTSPAEKSAENPTAGDSAEKSAEKSAGDSAENPTPTPTTTTTFKRAGFQGEKHNAGLDFSYALRNVANVLYPKAAPKPKIESLRSAIARLSTLIAAAAVAGDTAKVGELSAELSALANPVKTTSPAENTTAGDSAENTTAEGENTTSPAKIDLDKKWLDDNKEAENASVKSPAKRQRGIG